MYENRTVVCVTLSGRRSLRARAVLEGARQGPGGASRGDALSPPPSQVGRSRRRHLARRSIGAIGT
jgi:hypothetical protein